MPVEIYNPLDLKVGNVVGKSIGNTSTCIARLTLVVMQDDKSKRIHITTHKDLMDLIKPNMDEYYEDVIKFLDIAKKNEENTLQAKEEEDARLLNINKKLKE